MLLSLLVLLASIASSTAVGTTGPPTPGQGIYICSTSDSDPCPTSLGPGQSLGQRYRNNLLDHPNCGPVITFLGMTQPFSTMTKAM